jgi:putative membrane protein insertion efficiency factor
MDLFRKKLFILPILGYQYLVAPLLSSSCRFQPSCSVYAIGVIQKYGVVKGVWLSAKRLARCHPWGNHGYDPIPGE